MKITSYTKGYSLIEVLVAIAILMIAIVGPLTIAAKSIQSSQYARQQITATYFAQEGVTAIHAIRNESALAYINNPTANPNPWAWTVASGKYANLNACFSEINGCNIDFSDSFLENNAVSCATKSNCTLELQITTSSSKKSPFYVLNVTPPSPTPYTRRISLTPLNTGDEILITSTVEWNSKLLGGMHSVTATSSVFNIYK